MADVDRIFTPTELAEMPREEMACYLVGSYGPGYALAIYRAITDMAIRCKPASRDPEPPRAA